MESYVSILMFVWLMNAKSERYMESGLLLILVGVWHRQGGGGGASSGM